MVMPSPELTAILQQAMSPCPHFEGVCASHCTWRPEVGHIPRGFAGANGSSESVRLILVNAEPGNPADGEQYADASTGWVADHATYYESLLETNLLRRSGRPAPFHRNLRKILDLFWPNEALTGQLEKTWITDAVLCSAKFSGGPIARAVENKCVASYLARQIAVLPNAFIVTLGGKAARRLQRQNLHIHYLAQHPSARPNTSPEASWQRAAASFHAWLELAEADA
jgi:hypothetical protein